MIDREIRRRKRKAVNDLASALIKMSAAVQDIKDATVLMRAVYEQAGDKKSVATCDTLIAWAGAEDIDPRIQKRKVRQMLTIFTCLRED